MNDNAMIERWNPIDSAKMAVSVESVLYRILNNRENPFDFDEALENGIAFLEEAKSGRAIICGKPETSDFTGTLSPLRMFTAVYLDVAPEAEETDGDKSQDNILGTLASYKNLLGDVKETREIKSEKESIANSAYSFFSALSKFLMQQTDPISETYSQQI